MTQSVHNFGSGALHSQCPPPNAVRRRGGTYSSFLKFGLAAVLVLLLVLCMAAPVAADDKDLGTVYAYGLYNFVDVDLGAYPTWTNDYGNTLTFIFDSDASGYFIHGYDIVAEGTYSCSINGDRYFIDVKLPSAAISGCVYEGSLSGELIGNLIGSTILNDKYVTISGASEIALTNPNGTLTTLDWSYFGFDKTVGSVRSLDLGKWTVQAVFKRGQTYAEFGGAAITQYAPDYILGKPYYFTILSEPQQIFIISNSSGISEYGKGYIDIAYYDVNGVGYEDSYAPIRWRSDNPAVLGISSSSNTHADLQPRSTGKATIYAELASDPSVNASVTYTVEETTVSSMYVYYSVDLWSFSGAERNSDGSFKFDIVGETRAYADIYDQFGRYISSPNLEWKVISGLENITLTKDINDDRYVRIVPTEKGGSAVIKVTSQVGTPYSVFCEVEIKGIGESSGFEVHLSDYPKNLTLDADDGYVSAVVYDTSSKRYLPYEELNWSVADPNIVTLTVDNNKDYPTRYATLTPNAAGTTILRAEMKNNTLVNTSVSITVEDTVITSVDFSDWNDISVGDSHDAWFYLRDQFKRNLRSDTYEQIIVTSSNSSILALSSDYGESLSDTATVTTNSYLRFVPLKKGEVTITAKSQKKNSVVTSHTIKVYESVITSLHINAPNGVSNRSSPQIEVYIRDSVGDYVYDDGLIEWTVDDKSVLTLSSYYERYPTIIPNKDAVGRSTTIRAALKSDAAVYDEIKVTIAESVPTSVYISGETRMTVNPDRTYWASAYVRDQFNNRISEPIIWDVEPAILEITSEIYSYNEFRVTANAAGTAVITAYAESNPSLSQSMTVTVEQPVLTELHVNAPKGVSLSGSGTLSIYGYDQNGGSMSLSGCTVTSDNESVLTVVKRDDPWSKPYEYYTLTPISKGTAVITVTYGSMTKSCTVEVVEGVPAEIDAYWQVVDNNYPYGSYADYLLLNTNYGTAYAYVYDQFGYLFGDTVRWSVDNPEIVDVSSTISSSGSKIALFPKGVGKTTIHAVSTADESVRASFTVRVYAEKPTNYTPVVTKGEDIFFSGKSDAAKLQYYIFGTNYFNFGTVDVVGGTYSKNVSSNGLAAGQYFAVIQSPGEDGNFNITAIGNAICSINAAGQKTVLFDVTYRQSANAAHALCDAIQSESTGGDDTYDEFSFILTGPSSYINAIPSEIFHGEVLTVSGNAVGHSGEVVVVELLSTAFAAVPKEIVSSASFAAFTTKVGSDGYWEINIDTSGLNVDEYTVSIAVGQLNAEATKLTIVSESGVIPTPKKYTSVTSRSSPVSFNFPSGMRVENVYVTPETGLVAGQTVIVNADIRVPYDSCDISDYITFDTALTDAHLETTLKKSGRDSVSLKDTYRLDGFNLVYDYADVIVHLRLVGSVDSSAAGTSISPLTITGNISGVSTIYSLPSMKVVSGTPLINPGHSDNYVFVYENAGLSGLWYSETSAVTFEDGYIIGPNVEEGVYSCGNQIINITYPTAEVTAVSNSVSCLETIVDKSSKITFGVTSKVSSYSVGNGLGLMFTAPDGTQTTTFSGVDFNYTNPDAFRTPVSVADAAEGTWHVQAYFNADGTSGHLVTDTPQKYQLGKDVFTFSVGHIGTEDTLYAESTQDKYPIGDTIYLKGYNPTGKPLYLYMRGTNYPLTSLPLDSITEVNWEAAIQTDEATMANGKKPDAGVYTIYIAAASGISRVEDFDNSNICPAYITVPVALTQPGITITSAPSKVAVGGTLTVEGVAETASEVQYYIFGENYYSFDSVGVIGDTFTVTKSLADAKEGTYYFIAQHPMYDEVFNIWVSGSDVWMSYNKRLFSLNDRQSANAAMALCDALDSQNIDDMYAKFSFVISDESGGEITNPALTINAPSDVLFGDELIISGTSDLPSTKVSVDLFGHSGGVGYETITDADGNWKITVDTLSLLADSYTITANVGSKRIGCSVTIHASSFLKLAAPNEVALSNAGEYLTASIITSRSPSVQPYPLPTASPVQTTVSEYEYQIDNSAIFDLEAAGSDTWRIIPKAYGTANVTVTWKEDSSYTAVKQITVSEKNGVASITLDYNRRYIDNQVSTGINLTTADEYAWVGVYAYDAGKYLFRNETVTLALSNDCVGIRDGWTDIISGNGLNIYPKTVGETTLTAASASKPGISDTVTIKVHEPELSIEYYGNQEFDADIFTITKGSSSTLNGYVKTQYGDIVAFVDTWSVVNGSVAELTPPQFDPYGITINAVSVGTTHLTMFSSEHPDTKRTITVVVEEPKFEGVRMYISNSWQLSLDARSTLTVTAYDQYGYILPDEKVEVNIVNSSVLSLTPEGDGKYTVVPKNVGMTQIIAAVKDKVNDFKSATITVAKTNPRIVVSSQLGGTILPENGISYYRYYLTDQFYYNLDWELTAELGAENAEFVELSDVEFRGMDTMLKLVRTSSPEMTEDKVVSLILKNEEHNLQEITPIILTKESAEFYGLEVDGEEIRGIITTDNQVETNPAIISLEDGPKEIGVYSVGRTKTSLCYISTPADFTAESSDETVVAISTNDHVTPPYDLGFTLTPKKAGTATLTFTTGGYTLPIEVTVTGQAEIKSGTAQIMEPPVITSSNDKDGLFDGTTIVTIQTKVKEAEIYYTLDGTEPTNESTKYSDEDEDAGIPISETTTIKAFAMLDGYENSTVTTAVFTKYDAAAPPTYNVTILQTVGGTLTAVPEINCPRTAEPGRGVTITDVPYGTKVTITAEPADGYVFTSWSITGVSKGTVKEKTPKVTTFTVDSDDVEIKAVFTEYVDDTPKASSVKIVNIPKTIYKTDTGALNAVTYDQFRVRFSDNKVTWSSSAPEVITINENTGAYEAVACGYAAITATSTENPTVTVTCELSVYQPPTPYVNAKGVPPESAYVGIMSAPFSVDSTDTTYLNWDWADNTPVVKSLVAYPYPLYHTSSDTAAHTFAKEGTLTVSVTPSNKYGNGAAETFHVTVTHAPPRNVKIINGPSAVVAGDTVTYEAFATGADGFVWYLDGAEQNGPTFTIPEDYAGEHKVKVSAWKGTTDTKEEAEKTIHVSARAGTLGDFSDPITEYPEYPAVGEVVVFSIPAVSNATKYTWAFGSDVIETKSPSVSYTLTDINLNKVNVTAYNSAGTASEPKEYSFTNAGYKPKITEITADPASASAGTTVRYTAKVNEGSGPFTYRWVVDGMTVLTAAGIESNEYTYDKSWTVFDIKRHEVAVYVSNNYGEDRMPITYTVTPRPNSPAEIEGIYGPAVISDKHKADYTAVIVSNDDYTTEWYLNDVLLDNSYISHGGKQIMLKGKDLPAGKYVIKLVVTTEYEEVSMFEKTIERTSDAAYTKNEPDSVKDKLKDNEKENLKLKDAGTNEKRVIHLVGAVTVSDDDINQDGNGVYVEVKPVSENELIGFTNEMGNPSDVVLALNITPYGLKNEKDLKKSAEITLSIPRENVADPETQKFYRLDTGSVPEKWVRVGVKDYKVEGDDYVFTLLPSGFSKFISTTVALDESSEEVSKPDTPQQGSSSSSRDSGASTWLQPTAEPTPVPTTTAAEPTQGVPSVSPIDQPPQQTSTPAPFIGILAGLGAAGLLFTLRRK